MSNAVDNKSMHICIVGAGMGGLASALSLANKGFNHIDVYESASNLGFVGAGIQLAPNLARIVDRLGCWDDIYREAVNIEETSIRQHSSDKELANVNLAYVKQKYGYPHMVGHRSSLAGSLYKACQRHQGIRFFWSMSVTKVNSFSPKPSFTVLPRNGEPYRVDADMILGADGVKSNVRVQMLETLQAGAQIQDTNQAAYRIMLKREELKDDPELLALIDSNTVTRWIGEKRHVIAYPVSNHRVYNISTTQPDTNFAVAPSATYTTRGSKSSMLQIFHDFCPKVLRMLDKVPDGEVCEWKLRVHHPLPTWVHGSVALVGDACHPTLPHLAQGAAQAIEDAAVIAVVLSRMPNSEPSTINKTLRIYEKLRKQRAETLIDLAAASGKELHLGEGTAKEERDRRFAALDSQQGKVPDKWADADVQQMIYGHDCVKLAEDKFEEMFQSL